MFSPEFTLNIQVLKLMLRQDHQVDSPSSAS